jgi:predicted RNA-binding protein with TRAM domain
MPAVQRGKLVELNVEKFADDGTSTAHVDGVPVHVETVVRLTAREEG